LSKIATGTYDERCYGKKMTINFNDDYDDLKSSIAALIKARKPPIRAAPPLESSTCCCGKDRSFFNRKAELWKTSVTKSICPKQPHLDSFKQTKCCFDRCNKTLSQVVKVNINVNVCGECSMFVCHSCKRDFLPKEEKKRRRR